MKTLSSVTHRPRLIAAVIFGTLALGCGAASIAADGSAAPRVVVKFGDLNVSNLQGATTLYGRIEAAARKVCQSYETDSNPADISLYAVHTACVQNAIARAVRSARIHALFTIYKLRSHELR